MPSAQSVIRNRAADERQPGAGNSVRGADSLLRALAGGADAPRPTIDAKAGPSAQERKSIKRARRIADKGIEALETRSYKTAEALFDEAIAMLETPPARLWCYRLVAASKGANYEYVVNNYQRIRALASCEDEEIVADRAWIDCLVAAGFLQEALREAEMLSVRNRKGWAPITSVIGVIQARLGELDKAIATQKSILKQDPSNVLARWNLAIHQLEAGDLPEAFDNYEARWEWPDFPSERRTFDIPRWNGESLAGKRILVWREQGVGDEIRFSSLLLDLIATGAEVTFECRAKLAPLFRAAFPDIEIRLETAAALRKPSDYRDFDFHVPAGSLTRHFRPTVAEMQARCRPWLARDSKIEDHVRADMGVAPHEPVIGLSWRSANLNMQRNRHYMGADYLAPLKLLGKSKFICLQYDECREEVASMRQMGLPIYEFRNIDQMNDLVSASYLAGACDLIISAPTATAELSAGLGVPTIMFGVAHSHIQLGTDEVPWHPATRYMTLDSDDPIGIAKSVLFDWKEIAPWAEKSSTSGRKIDWQLSYPGAA